MDLPAKNALRRVKYFVLDHWEVASGKRDSLTPPLDFKIFGAGSFRETGQEFVNYFVRLAGLRTGITIWMSAAVLVEWQRHLPA
jgi:hypothetical protein